MCQLLEKNPSSFKSSRTITFLLHVWFSDFCSRRNRIDTPFRCQNPSSLKSRSFDSSNNNFRRINFHRQHNFQFDLQSFLFQFPRFVIPVFFELNPPTFNENSFSRFVPFHPPFPIPFPIPPPDEFFGFFKLQINCKRQLLSTITIHPPVLALVPSRFSSK